MPVMIDNVPNGRDDWGGAEMRFRQTIVNSILGMEGTWSSFYPHLCMAYGAAVVVMAFDETGQTDTTGAQG